MPARNLSESRKRRREAHQLSLHQCAELKRRRGSRSEEAVSTVDHHFSFQHRDHCAQPMGGALPPAVAAAATNQGAAAAPVSALCCSPLPHHSIGDKLHWLSRDSMDELPASPAICHVAEHACQENNAKTSNELVLRLRPIHVDVVCGDTGRRNSFYLQPTFLYAWHRGNHFYHRLDGEQVGLELQETVLCQVLPTPAIMTPPPPPPLQPPQRHAWPLSPASSLHPRFSAPSWPLHRCVGSSAGTQTVDPATTAATLSSAPHGHLHHAWCAGNLHKRSLLYNEEAASIAAAATVPSLSFCAASYSYEATQVSRCLSPPACPDAPTTNITACLGSGSPALFVECLLKCIRDEAVLPDDHSWVYLYHGRHMLTEVGRTRLLHDLFAHAYFVPVGPEGETQSTLTVCVFRKY
jgi:hypothetical protein